LFVINSCFPVSVIKTAFNLWMICCFSHLFVKLLFLLGRYELYLFIFVSYAVKSSVNVVNFVIICGTLQVENIHKMDESLFGEGLTLLNNRC